MNNKSITENRQNLFSRLSFRTADRRSQLGVAFVLMTVIPILTLGYFLTSYVLPNVITRESVLLVIMIITVLAFCGFTILKNEIYWKTDELESSNLELRNQIAERNKVAAQLKYETTLLEALSETSIDGILVVDDEGQSVVSNKCFGVMWNIPQAVLDTRNDERMLEVALKQLKCPEEFIEKVKYLYAHKSEASRDEIEIKDGRTFDRYSSPVIDTNEHYYGRVWFFRDITKQKKAEDALRKSKNQLEALGARLAVTQEVERKRLAGELHDQVGETLTLLSINLAYIRDHLVVDSKGEISTRLNDAIGLGKEMAKRIREVILELRPTVLDDYGLMAALNSQCEYFSKRTSIPVDVVGEEPAPRLPSNIETVLFRITQEGMNNLAKHSNCTKASVTLDETNEGISLVIEDNGVGFDTKTLKDQNEPSGFGLIMMRERISSIGGQFMIESEPGKGTRILIKVGR